MNHTKGTPGSRKRAKGESPVRMCAICRQHMPADQMIRWARPEKPGRGIYICRNEECVRKAMKRGLVGEENG